MVCKIDTAGEKFLAVKTKNGVWVIFRDGLNPDVAPFFSLISKEWKELLEEDFASYQSLITAAEKAIDDWLAINDHQFRILNGNSN